MGSEMPLEAQEKDLFNFRNLILFFFSFGKLVASTWPLPLNMYR